ncbi:hypothetical protein Tco_0776002 [Tanacetum coccineum]
MGAKMKLASSPHLHLVKWAAKKTNDESGTRLVSVQWKTFSGPRRMTTEDQCAFEWKTLLDGKLVVTRRMTKKINVHPEWKTLQTLTNGHTRKLDRSPPSSGKRAASKKESVRRVGPSFSVWYGKLLGPRRMTKKINKWAAKRKPMNWRSRLGRIISSFLVNGCKRKTNGIGMVGLVESSLPSSESSPPSSGKWAVKRKPMNWHRRFGRIILLLHSGTMGCLKINNGLGACLDGKLLGPRRMTKKINVHPEWKTLQTLTNELACILSSQAHTHTYPHKKDDKEDECASRVVDSSNTNQWGKKEAGSSPPSSGKWAAKRKLMMRVGPLVLSLDGKLLGPRRMTKKINVHPEWKILQTLTNGAKRKLDHLLLHLSGWKTSWAKKDDKEDQCASRVVDSSNTNQWGKKEAGSSPPSSGKWAAKRKLMMRVGPLVLSLDGKLLGPRRMTKKINVHPEWVDSSNTNQCGKKEAGSSPPSSGKWAAKRKLMMRVGPLVLSLDGKLLGQEGYKE